MNINKLPDTVLAATLTQARIDRMARWASRGVDALTAKVQRRDLRTAIDAVSVAQVWLRTMGYDTAADALTEPIADLSKRQLTQP